MNRLAKLAHGAMVASGIALSAAAPAQAGVSVGVGIGVPGPGPGYDHRRWCYNHPGACGGGPGYVGVNVGGPAIGVYVGGRGYWDGHRYWGHRSWDHGGWRYR